MTVDAKFGYPMPYDNMVGFWAGVSIVYRPNGEYICTVPSQVGIYWKRPHAFLHYRQDEQADLDRVLKGEQPLDPGIDQIIHHSFDLVVTGKACASTRSTVGMSVAGTETRPDVYLFHLAFPQGHYYNNQYFTSPNERHIVGPYVVPNPKTRTKRGSTSASSFGEIKAVVAQTFTRISYEVPQYLIRNLP